MQEYDLREKYISDLMQRGTSRKVAEETVDIMDDDGNIVGLISEDVLQLELCIRDIICLADVRKDLARHILESSPSIPDKLRHVLEEDAQKPPAVSQDDAAEK